MRADRQHNFSHQVEATMVEMLLDRQKVAIGMISGAMTQLKAQGYIVAAGFNFEQDSAKMSLKSSGFELVGRLSERLKQLEAVLGPSRTKGRQGHFQQSSPETMLTMSGKVIMVASREGEKSHTHTAVPLEPPPGRSAERDDASVVSGSQAHADQSR